MKKIFIALALIVTVSISATNVKAQKVTMANYTDTLSGSTTKYYAAPVQADLFYGSFGIYVDHLTGSTDSTIIVLQGSLDGSTWIQLGSTAYANILAVGDPSPTTFKAFKVFTTDAGMVWTLTDRCTLPYYRWAVTHYATGTVRVKGWLYKKK